MLYLLIISVTEHLTAQCGAVKMLNPRLKLIVDYVKAVKSGSLPKNDDILRKIGSLCACLPVAQSEAFKNEYSMVRFSINLKHCCVVLQYTQL